MEIDEKINKHNEMIKQRVIGCNRCHRITGEKGVTLIKGKDSYYCTECYMYLKNRGLQ